MWKILWFYTLAILFFISWARPHGPRRITAPTTTVQQQQQNFETTGEIYIDDKATQTTTDRIQTSQQQFGESGGNDSSSQQSPGSNNLDFQATVQTGEESALAKENETATIDSDVFSGQNGSKDILEVPSGPQPKSNSPKSTSVQSHSPRHIVPDQPLLSVQGQLNILPENPQGQQNIGLPPNAQFVPQSPALQKPPELLVSPTQIGGHWDQQQRSFVRAPLTAEDLEKFSRQQLSIVRQGSSQQQPLPEPPAPQQPVERFERTESATPLPQQQVAPAARNKVSNVQQQQIGDFNEPILGQSASVVQQRSAIPAQPKEQQLPVETQLTL